MNRALFRKLLLGVLGFQVAAIAVQVAGTPWLPGLLQTYAEGRSGSDWSVTQTVAVILSIPMALWGMVSWLGLYTFWRPARFLAGGCVLVMFGLKALAGPEVALGVEALFQDLAMVFLGASLAIAYSPLGEPWFEAK